MTAKSEIEQKNKRPVEPTFRHWPSAKGEALGTAILDKTSEEDEDIETMLATAAAQATVV